MQNTQSKLNNNVINSISEKGLQFSNLGVLKNHELYFSYGLKRK